MTPITDRADDCFLPNFCGLRMVFVVVVIAQLFAFVMVLSPGDIPLVERWQQLGLISLFVQWCALVCSAALCIMRRYLVNYSSRVVAIVSYVTVLLVVWLVSEAAYWHVYPGAQQTMSHWAFVVRNVVITFLLTGPILRYFYINHQWEKNVRAEAEARLQSLQSRIRPHFLFNSMNTIASLTRSAPAQAEAAVEDLADLFRASLRDARQFHSLEEELTLCRRYLAIEGLRLGERLKIDWQVDDVPQDALLPPLLIQPLVENAVYHGIEPRPEGGTILIKGDIRDKQIHLQVCNPLSVQSKESNGNRIAQENIRARLATLYGKRAGMDVQEADGMYCVDLNWPYWNRFDEDTDH